MMALLSKEGQAAAGQPSQPADSSAMPAADTEREERELTNAKNPSMTCFYFNVCPGQAGILPAF